MVENHKGTNASNQHDAKLVIGKKYYWKSTAKTNEIRPLVRNAIGPNGYSLASCSSAELSCASSW
tara:strand:- start:2046 stop:2240 length:195 start_codon:yes stop_codon:yes gene_type:complete